MSEKTFPKRRRNSPAKRDSPANDKKDIFNSHSSPSTENVIRPSRRVLCPGDEGDVGSQPSVKRVHMEEPLVVVASGLVDQMDEADIIDALSGFGPVAYVIHEPWNNAAYAEFETAKAAKACVEYSAIKNIFVAGSLANFEYAPYIRTLHRNGLETCKPTKVLMLTIYNTICYLNTTVMYNVCKPFGDPLRVKILRRYESQYILQALIEFENTDVAHKVKHSINGADVFESCCTVKCEFADLNRERDKSAHSKSDHVRVDRNNEDAWDFTTDLNMPPMPRYDGEGNPNVYDLGDKAATNDYWTNGNDRPYGTFFNQQTPSGPQSLFPSNDFARVGFGPRPMDAAIFGNSITTADAPHFPPGSVLMVHGMNVDVMNCAHLFNFLCLYGDVQCIRILRNPQGGAMVQMSSPDDVNRIVDIRTVTAFGSEICFSVSRQNSVNYAGPLHPLRDGTPSVALYYKSNLHRFNRDSARSRFVTPNKSLYLYSAPKDMDDNSVFQMFAERGAPLPINVRFIDFGGSKKSSSANCEFANSTLAIEALMLANNFTIHSPHSKYPYVVKLNFSDDFRGSRFGRSNPSGSVSNETTSASTSEESKEKGTGSDAGSSAPNDAEN